MKDSELQFDRNHHALYSGAYRRKILEKIALHYPRQERASIWNKVQIQFADYLNDWPQDNGGKCNPHNQKGGTYDCIAIMCYYVICKSVTSLAEIEEMVAALLLSTFSRLRFVNCNKPHWLRLMHRAFTAAKAKSDKWQDYYMEVQPYVQSKPIYYEFTKCPIADFAKRFNLTDIMPAMCNPDYAAMEMIHARIPCHKCANYLSQNLPQKIALAALISFTPAPPRCRLSYPR